MAVSSRTPEGWPHRCPVCGREAALEPALPAGDAVCPSCGSLVWWFRDRLGADLGIDLATVRLDTPLDALGLDSLDVAEIVMEAEERFGVELTTEELEHVRTVEDLLRLIEERRDDPGGPTLQDKRRGMTTSVNGRAGVRRSYRPTAALAKSVEFDDDMMHVALTDGRVVGVPLVWFPVLHAATPEQRAAVQIGGGGVGLHWPELDEDLSVAGLLAGADPQSG